MVVLITDVSAQECVCLCSVIYEFNREQARAHALDNSRAHGRMYTSWLACFLQAVADAGRSGTSICDHAIL